MCKMYGIIEELCAERGIKPGKLCAELGISRGIMSDLKAGRTKRLSAENIEKVSGYFGVSSDYLLGVEPKEKTPTNGERKLPPNIIPMPEMRKVPLIGTIACGEPILAEEHIEGYVGIPENIRADFALICKGDSMVGAGIRDGDVVYIRNQETVDNGQIAAVIIDGIEAEATLKRFYFSEGAVTLMPENSSYQPSIFVGSDIERVRIVGLAVGYTHAFEWI